MRLPLTGLALASLLCACSTGGPPPADRAARELPVTPAEVELITRADLFGNPERSSPRISPDGRQLSWLAPLDGVLNLWVAPVDLSSPARAVTADRGRGVSYENFWTYRPDTLLYLRDDGGDENFHLHAVDLASGHDRDLTPYPATAAVVVAVSPRRPERILVAMNDRDPQWHDLYQVDLASGKRTLLERNDSRIANWFVDHDYRLHFASRVRADGSQELLRRRDGKWIVEDEIPFEDTLGTRPLGLSADGDTLYLLDSRGRDTVALFTVDAATGERRLLAEDPRADVGEVLFEPRSGQAQAVTVDYLRKEWRALDAALADDFAHLAELGSRDSLVLSRSLDDRNWIIAYSAAEEPTRYYRYARPDGTLQKLFSSRPELEGKPLVPMWPQEIPARDGLTLVSYLTLPAAVDPTRSGRASHPVPMVLWVHGGPWWRDTYGYDPYAQWLANRGYAVLSVNFRGSTGFGKAFINAGNGEWAGKMHDDLLDAVQWAIDQGITRRDQVAIMGGSYGGYATLVGLSFTPDTFACGVDIVGPSNLVTLLKTIPPYWASFFEQFARRVGDPRTEAGRALLTERSPLTRAARISRPLLIGQGANDPRVNQAESEQIVAAMRERQIPVTYVLFPDEGHGFARPENSTAFNAVAESFLADCLGGRAQPIGTDLQGSSTTVPVGAELVQGLAAALEAHRPEARR